MSEKLAALRASPATTRAKAKFILATDGEGFEAEDLQSGETLACAYQDFPDHFGFFLPLAGITTVKQLRDSSIDIRASSRLNKLYVELLKDNPGWGTAARREEVTSAPLVLEAPSAVLLDQMAGSGRPEGNSPATPNRRCRTMPSPPPSCMDDPLLARSIGCIDTGLEAVMYPAFESRSLTAGPNGFRGPGPKHCDAFICGALRVLCSALQT